MKKSILFVGLTSLLLAACGGEEDTADSTVVDNVVEELCVYSYSPDETVLTWTAFKLTEKMGVNGTFDQINVNANDGSEDMFAVLSGATFTIPVNSLNSQDDVRDPKIKESFFGVMTETSEISGTIKSLSETGGTIEIKMNGKAVSYDGEVKVEGEEITWLGTIDLLDFDGQAAVDSLGVVCEEKHTGTDGVNKLWTDVDIAVKTTLTKACK